MTRPTAGPQLPLDVRHREGPGPSHADLVAGVLDALPSPTVLIEADGTMLLVNSAWAAAGQLLPDDRLQVGVGGNYFEVMLSLSDDPVNRERIDSLRALSRGERKQVSADYALSTVVGQRWFHLQASRADQSGRVVVTHTDVTSRVEAEQTSAWQARHDHLTDLPNRAHLHELITTELRRPDRGAVTALFLDVDGFKDVNDTLGHEVGDHLLRELAHRLSSRTRGEDTVGRLGGDEFVVCCPDLPGEAPAESLAVIAARLRQVFAVPIEVTDACEVIVGASIGTVVSTPTSTVDQLLHDSDQLMYQQKRSRADIRTLPRPRSATALESAGVRQL